MSFLRRVAGLSLRDRVRSSVIRQELGVDPLLLRVERSQMRWLWHLVRMPPRRLPGEVFRARPTGLLQVVKQNVKVPIYVMIRPRGGDFLYSEQEVEVMRKDIQLMKSHGADGLVLGALTEDGRVDAELCMELLALSRPLPVTFHRAFDMVQEPEAALETLVYLGFHRLLTSGCDCSALEGLPVIKRLVNEAKGRIAIMPGGGITERNLQRILEGSGAREVHCSARSSRDSAMKFRNSCVTMGSSFSAPEYGLKVADASKVRTLNAIARNAM
ncbi:Copper homeostasis protein cutC [Merluccius polli]|uniref:Copper homeostasis protein cutC homolog n=1 Tax=Merluccius polli TaxID=89951 RepID=A0AA47MDX6_MERPO|nr:Copper homeostasis protein cutC [Merluccius polli]